MITALGELSVGLNDVIHESIAVSPLQKSEEKIVPGEPMPPVI